jgi:hypothetical protein
MALTGGATDNQDLVVASTNLRWSSDRDGSLGTGDTLNAFLSVGAHVLTLEAENSLGLRASTSTTVTVIGDYDGDGIGDEQELTDGLDLLTAGDAVQPRRSELDAQRRRGMAGCDRGRGSDAGRNDDPGQRGPAVD